VSRFQFVADHQHTFEVKRLCQLVEVSRSSFYAWQQAAQRRARRAAADAELADRIRAVHDQDRGYGAPRVTAELNDGAPARDRVNHKRVARVMREHHIAGIRLRRRVRTTVPEPSHAKVPDLVRRDFTAPAPNRKYVGDITYLPIVDGTHLYLATVIDCHSRRLVGWAVADHMRTSLVTDALTAARATRGSLAGAIFHADHGAQYTSKDVANLCRQLKVRLSMGAVGSSADNALAVVQRHPQTRDPRRRPVLARPGHLQPSDLPLGHPLQHPPPPLLLRIQDPHRLRERHPSYAPERRITTTPRVQPPGSSPVFARSIPYSTRHFRTMSVTFVKELSDLQRGL
jgi:transposase InsO family protein